MSGSYFFFSSRRRHTRLQGDWSSDVCSSDLSGARLEPPMPHSTTRSNFCRISSANAANALTCCAIILPTLRDRKSTRLNSSHLVISYAVFCLKKKNRIPLQPAQSKDIPDIPP